MISNALMANDADSSTMNSYEFWKLVNTFRLKAGENIIEHNKFLARVIDECPEITVEKFATVIYNDKGQTIKVVNLDHDHMILVGMRESRIVRRNVLEWIKSRTAQPVQLQQPAIPQTFAEALRLAAEQQDRIEQQAAVIQIQKPKVEYHDAVLSTEGAMCIRDALKSIGYKPNKAAKWLRENGYLGADCKAYQKHIEAGYYIVRQRKDRQDTIRTQTMVTAKGAQWLARNLSMQLELRA